MIAIPNFNPKNGLYQIDEGKIHKYKAKGGTVRVYDLIEIIQCKECKYYNGHEQYCEIDHFARENGFCSDGKRLDENRKETYYKRKLQRPPIKLRRK